MILTMKNETKKICVVTSSRADYGIMSNLIQKIDKDTNFKLSLLVTGSHLIKKYGYTFNEIKKDRIKLIKKIPFKRNLLYEKDIGEILKKFSKVLKKLQPKIVILLGDRYEIFAVALAAFLLKIPIAHIHGGEVTQGSMDDTFRHCITKFSYLHFASTKASSNRIKQLGEQKKNIYNVGSLSLENLGETNFLSKNFFEKKYQIKLNKDIIVIVFHPNTLKKDNEISKIKEIALSLNKLKNFKLIFTGSNIDNGGKEISKIFKDLVSKNKSNSFFAESFGRREFISILKMSKIIIGNSSSGIIEAPSMQTFTINFGDRQKGREQAQSIFNCDYNKNNFYKIFHQINKIENIRKYFLNNPYKKPNVANKIISILKKPIINEFNIKKFNDQ